MENSGPNPPLELDYQSTLDLEKQGRQAGLALLLCALYVALLGIAGIVGMLINLLRYATSLPPGMVVQNIAAIVIFTGVPAGSFLWSRSGMLRRSRRAVSGGRTLALGMCAIFGFQAGAIFLGMVFDRPGLDEMPIVGAVATVTFTGLVLFVWTAWLLGRVRRLLSQ